ncbi:MAG: VOC family protein [Bacteroidales bacterium]|nr:VOC family protein [Bacteroidales bacterium]
MPQIIAGIRQPGIGVSDVYQARDWYSKYFGYDVAIFDEDAMAALMLRYTDNTPQHRHAILTYNMKGGGGFEIWQYKQRTPVSAEFDLQPGDLGFYACKIKAPDVEKAHADFTRAKLNVLSPVVKAPDGGRYFFMKDPYGNRFQIEQGSNWLLRQKKLTGGSSGLVIGVSNMQRSIDFYKNILGYDHIIYDNTGVFDDWQVLDGGKERYRRVLLGHHAPRVGAFSPLLGETRLELVQALDRTPRKIYHDRLWGDLGFIHVCFDVVGMDALRQECAAAGHAFTVDSSDSSDSTDSFDMGEAAGHFGYIEDPDGALIEFVETHKIPMLKKLGWYLNLKKRGQIKPLPRWFFKVMAMTRRFKFQKNNETSFKKQ